MTHMKLNNDSMSNMDNYFKDELAKFRYKMKGIINGKNDLVGSNASSTFLIHCICSILSTYNSTQGFKRNIVNIVNNINITKANKKDDDFLISQTIHNLAVDIGSIWSTYGDIDFNTINVSLLNDVNIDNFNILKDNIDSIKDTEDECKVLSKIPFKLYTGNEYEMFKSSLDNIIKRTLLQKSSMLSALHGSFTNSFNDIKYMSNKSLLDTIIDETSKIMHIQNNLVRDIMNSKETRSIDKVSLDVLDSGFKDIINVMVEDTIKADDKIKTRSIAFNQFLGGGLERGSLVTGLGISGGGKSNIALMITLDSINPTLNMQVTPKKPLVIYFSNENSNKKTMERIFSHQTGNRFEAYKEYIRTNFDDNFNRSEVNKYIANAIFNDLPFTITEDTKQYYNFTDNEGNTRKQITLIMRYIPPSGTCTNDLKDIIEEYEVEGYEMVGSAVDYMSRMIPNDKMKTDNMYSEKGKISNELRELAVEKNMFIFTAVQANKESMDKVISGKKLSSSNIAESSNITHNSDVLFHYNVDNLTKRFATISSLKNRNVGDIPECYIMFDLNKLGKPNNIRLSQDYYNPLLYNGPKNPQTSSINFDDFCKINNLNDDLDGISYNQKMPTDIVSQSIKFNGL